MKLKGRLMYMGWMNRPWTLNTDDGEIDLWPIVKEFFVSFNGKRANHKQNRDRYTLFADENSDMKFAHISDSYNLLSELNAHSKSNVSAYLDETLIWLDGRMVEIEIEDAILVWSDRMVEIKIEDGKQFKIKADESEKVHGVYSIIGSNTCNICEGDEHKICRIGTPKACVFAVLDPSGAWCCCKFDENARGLLYRLAKGDIRATHIGSCQHFSRGMRDDPLPTI